MEYCGGGSVTDIMDILENSLNESQIRFIVKETLKVCFLLRN